MPVENANSYLPNDSCMLRAFDTVKTTHRFGDVTTPEDLHRYPFKHLGVVMGDYFTAGVAYLANRGQDQYLQDIGTQAWWAVNRKRVRAAFTTDILGAALELGLPEKAASQLKTQAGEPHVLFQVQKEESYMLESAYVLMPPEFFLKANNTPIEALATMAWICSKTRDMSHGRLILDPQHLEPRAVASEAHFLKFAQQEHPEIELNNYSRKILKAFPEGIKSLPLIARYWEKPDQESQPA